MARDEFFKITGTGSVLLVRTDEVAGGARYCLTPDEQADARGLTRKRIIELAGCDECEARRGYEIIRKLIGKDVQETVNNKWSVRAYQRRPGFRPEKAVIKCASRQYATSKRRCIDED